MKLLIRKSKYSEPLSYSYYFCTQKEDLSKFTDQILELPPLTQEESEKFKKYQHDLIVSLKNYNLTNPVFMCSPLGCENMWQSSFFLALENFFRFKQLLKGGHDTSIICPDSYWYSLIKLEAQKLGYVVDFAQQVTLRKKFCKGLYNLFYAFKKAYQAFRNILNLSLPFMNKAKIAPQGYDVIFFTTWFQRTLQSYKNDKLDPFFGDLPTLIEQRGKKTALFCHIENFVKANTEDISALRQNNIYTYHQFLTLTDVLSIFLKVLVSQPKIPLEYKFLSKCIKRDVSCTKWIQSLHALMIQCIAKKFIRLNSNIKVFYTFEGNCWEKGISLAAQGLALPLSMVYGYQHTGFSEFQQKLKAFNPLFPGKIISTGAAASQSLATNFLHKKTSVLTGCHLRGAPFPHTPLKKSFPFEITKILLLLQGTTYDILFLQKAAQYIQGFSGEVMVRLHPAWQKHPLQLPINYLRAEGTLQDNLRQSDIVIHSGTTAALEAAYCGIPSVYLDLGFSYKNNILIKIDDNLFFQHATPNTPFDKFAERLKQSNMLFDQHLYDFRQSYELFFSPATLSAKEALLSLVYG